jgi:hypothetical protein
MGEERTGLGEGEENRERLADKIRSGKRISVGRWKGIYSVPWRMRK